MAEEALSDNERLRMANDALRARMERQAVAEPAGRGPETPETAAWARRYVEVALEASRTALALFSDEGRLIALNGRLSALFADVAARLTPGMRYEDCVRLISGSSALDLSGEEIRAAWARSRIAARGRTAAPAITPLTGARWVEIAERRAGYGAFALGFEDVSDQMRVRLRDRGAAGEGPGLVQGALDNLPLGVGVFDRDGGLALWNEPFRLLLGLGVADMTAGAAFEHLAGRVAAAGVIDPGGPARRIALWAAGLPPRRPMTAELHRAEGVVIEAQCRETPEGGFVVALADMTEERRAAREVERVRRTLEQRVTERTGALVELNDRLVQEVAERRAIEAEMRRARDAAEAANLSKTRFLAAASHDLLQPLSAAKLFVSALNAGALPEAAADTVRKIDGALVSVETLLGALLDISRLDAGGGEAEVLDFPISRILNPVAEEFRPVAAARGLRLRVAPSNLVVRSDPRYLRRIVQNLVGNALKYTLSGGVVVGCRRRGAMARIEVWDSGVGIPAAERRRIFEEFHRIDGANPRGERGMGLGLAIVDRAARLLGHPIDLRSAEGAGSTFAVSAPIGDSAAAQAAQQGPWQAASDGGEAGMIALVLDDDSAVRAATAALLARWGVDAIEAADADEALAAAEALGMAPDVILADYHLARGDTGVSVIRRLRAAQDAAIPAILITADRSAAVAGLADAVGAPLLTKPVAAAKLRALLGWARSQRPPG